MKTARAVAFSALMTALGVVVVIASAYFARITLFGAVAASIFPVFTAKRCSLRYASLCFAAVSTLSLLLSPVKAPAVLFCLFFGWYPLVKPLIEGKFNGVKTYLIKFALLNLALFAAIILWKSVFDVPFALLIAAVVVSNFLLYPYDRALLILFRFADRLITRLK